MNKEEKDTIKIRMLKAYEIDVRVQSLTSNGAILVLYKDARCDMNILDETFGIMGWQRSHLKDNSNCVVSIYDKEKKQWISKEDTGSAGKIEKDKAIASDSFKRACFNWGIGRELYSTPFIFVNKDKFVIKDNKTYDKFVVTKIEYNENREIIELLIKNEDMNKNVFHYNKKQEIKKIVKKKVEKEIVKKKEQNKKEIKEIKDNHTQVILNLIRNTKITSNDIKKIMQKQYPELQVKDLKPEDFANFFHYIKKMIDEQKNINKKGD